MKEILKQIINHTAKTPDGRWSRMSIILITSWAMVLGMAIIDFCIEGFRLDVWMTFVGAALGTKVVDAQATKIASPNKVD